MKEFKVDRLEVVVEKNAMSIGAIAAQRIRTDLISLLASKPEINVMFAAAPSQNTALEALTELDGIEWNRINAFHMDEYVGISMDCRQSFRNYLLNHLFSRVPFKTVNLIAGDDPNTAAVISSYENMIKERGIDLIVLGIGESGHIAFNDPPDAKFDDPHYVKEVRLSEVSRIQQVHDKCFNTIEEVPKRAITVTIPAFMSAHALHCIVPGSTKAKAVKTTLEGPISESCPASILRRHANAHLYIDMDSAAELEILG